MDTLKTISALPVLRKKAGFKPSLANQESYSTHSTDRAMSIELNPLSIQHKCLKTWLISRDRNI